MFYEAFSFVTWDHNSAIKTDERDFGQKRILRKKGKERQRPNSKPLRQWVSLQIVCSPLREGGRQEKEIAVTIAMDRHAAEKISGQQVKAKHGSKIKKQTSKL